MDKSYDADLLPRLAEPVRLVPRYEDSISLILFLNLLAFVD